ncbi:hypothetical protein C6497_06080 [Candidatus Poribacteria bacterium]|nr:MAG: hypothetical protein C6497_06080 [Candidatus Poribacteria bacterium]
MRHIKLLVWIIFILSGASALIYEVIWMRQLTLVFGSTVFATSTVLTAFMAGLALGSYYFGRKIDESKISPLKLYAFLEAGIGGFCIIWHILLAILSALYVLIFRHITSEFYTLSLIRFILTFGILLIPSTLMGGTLPVLTRFFVKRLEQLGTNIGILYALNTFGAVIGTVAAGFFLIQALGIKWTLGVAIAINLGVALIALLLDQISQKSENAEDASRKQIKETAEQDTEPEIHFGKSRLPLRNIVLIAIGISGFSALSYEVLWTRILVFFLGSTTYAFATMLAAFLFGIALGSMILARWVDRIKQPVITFGLIQLGIGFFAVILMPAFEELYGVSSALQSTFGASRFWAFFSCFLVMSLPTFLMGASFPLVTKIYTGNEQQLGRSIGNVYAVNTVGSILGAFCAGFILIPLLNIRPSIILMVALNTGIGCLLVLTGWRSATGIEENTEIEQNEPKVAKAFSQGLGIGIPIITLGLAAVLLFSLNQPIFLKSTIYKTQRPGDQVVDYQEEVDATVTTLKDDEGVYRLYVDANQAADASRWDSPSHRVIAHLPLLLHPNPKRALVVGFGMGLTSHSITQHGVKVDAIELSKGVISAAREYFVHINRNIFKNRLFKYQINDGRNHILMTKTKYDMISTGIIHPLVSAGSSNIYTKDFYRLCRRILSEDGVMCQWVPLHRLPEPHYKMIVRTFIDVFPETTLWYKYTPDFVILIGTSKPLSINYENFIARSKIRSIQEGLAADDLDGMSLLDSFMMGPKAVKEYAGVGPIHTDDRPRLEFFKGKDLANSTVSNIKGMHEYRESVIPYLRNYGTTLEEQKLVREKINTYYKATQKLILGQIAYANAQTAYTHGQVDKYNSFLETASMQINEGVRINPRDDTIRYNFGVVSGLIREDEHEELRKIEQSVKQTMVENPEDSRGHIYLFTVYEGLAREFERKGEFEKANEHLSKASKELEEYLKRDSSRPDIYILLGPLYERQGRFSEALRTYERLELLETEGELPAPIYVAMAQLHWELKNVEEAKEYSQKGLNADANSWRSHYILGKVYHSMNQTNKQNEHFESALKVIDEAITNASDPSDLLTFKEEIQKELEEIK